jgi:hypothetical protein
MAGAAAEKVLVGHGKDLLARCGPKRRNSVRIARIEEPHGASVQHGAEEHTFVARDIHHEARAAIASHHRDIVARSDDLTRTYGLCRCPVITRWQFDAGADRDIVSGFCWRFEYPGSKPERRVTNAVQDLPPGWLVELVAVRKDHRETRHHAPAACQLALNADVDQMIEIVDLIPVYFALFLLYRADKMPERLLIPIAEPNSPQLRPAVLLNSTSSSREDAKPGRRSSGGHSTLAGSRPGEAGKQNNGRDWREPLRGHTRKMYHPDGAVSITEKY